MTASCCKEYVILVENTFNKRVKKLNCDNGKEYLSKEIYQFINEKGIELFQKYYLVHPTSIN